MKKILRLSAIIALAAIVSVMTAGCGDTASGDNDSDSSASKGASYDVGDAIVTSWTDSIDSVWVQAAVPVTNTGDVNLSLSSATMDVEDSEGNLVASLSLVSAFPDVIGPGETAWYYETSTLDSAPSSQLTAVPHFEAQEVKNARTELEVSDTSMSEFYGDISVIGKVTNTTEEELDMVEVAAFLYDSESKLIGLAFTYADGTLSPGESISFEAITLAIPSTVSMSAIADYKVIAYQENIIDF